MAHRQERDSVPSGDLCSEMALRMEPTALESCSGRCAGLSCMAQEDEVGECHENTCLQWSQSLPTCFLPCKTGE